VKAAVVTQFGRPPQYIDFTVPSPTSDTEMIVDVLAVGLHPRVRSQAAGSHYTSTDELPLVPGIDGVGRGSDGLVRYFILLDTTMGAMAEQTLIDERRSVVLPEDVDPVAVAAAMNPAMSSWVALTKRISFQAGQNVLILGATGNAGQLAVQIAKRFGAKKIVAVGRGADALAPMAALGATDTVLLNQPDTEPRLGQTANDIDVALDYLWGQPTADALHAIIPARADEAQQLTWIQIGSVAGVTSPLPSAALRAARLQIVGSGQGSVSAHDILAELPGLAETITKGVFAVNARAIPLANVESAWAWPNRSGERLVIIP
jgi:NADPH:quinone reductase-like Zn-dependent oxidoreductase